VWEVISASNIPENVELAIFVNSHLYIVYTLSLGKYFQNTEYIICIYNFCWRQ